MSRPSQTTQSHRSNTLPPSHRSDVRAKALNGTIEVKAPNGNSPRLALLQSAISAKDMNTWLSIAPIRQDRHNWWSSHWSLWIWFRGVHLPYGLRSRWWIQWRSQNWRCCI